MNRRKFIEKTSLTSLAVVSPISIFDDDSKKSPVVVCTWNFPNANHAAWKMLVKNSSALDAVEQGVKVEEADVNNQSVGKGGRPDRDGIVTLDACVADQKGNYGAVTALQNVTHAVSVARKVMEDTPHVILTGYGAEQFAYEKGFKKENLLTEKSKQEWLAWKKKSKYKPIINIENHDTIGMLAIDKSGDISGACTTSGLAFKMHGRVGDSPIFGAGLYLDNDIGGAVATGVGEEVLKTVGSFLIVELMRQGRTPGEACKEAVKRIVSKSKDYKNLQVAYLALNKEGEIGSYAIQKGFSYRKNNLETDKNIISDAYLP